MDYSRRNFIKGIAYATAAIPFSGAFASVNNLNEKKLFPISFFTKPLDGFELEFMAETLAMSGIDGFDLAVRPKGRVEPERVADDLPKVIETGKKYKIETRMMVTSITGTTDDYASQVLKIAADNGIKHYRLGYFNYDSKKSIPESLVEIKSKMNGLVKMNAEFGIQGGYQNHSGTRVGAPMWDVWELIKGLPVEFMSSQFDVRHAVTEGNASWVITQRLLSRNIGSLAIKDFTWEVKDRKASVVSTPLGEGIVDFDMFFLILKELQIVAPISLHVEYPFLNKEEETLSLLEKQRIIVSKLKKDVDFIRTMLAKHQLT